MLDRRYRPGRGIVAVGGIGGVSGVAGGAGSGRLREDQEAARAWARAVLELKDSVILDTETTGLDGGAQVVQVGVLSLEGEVLLDTLVKPTGRIPWQATAVHRITDDDCAGAPAYPEVHGRLKAAIGGRTVIAYNAAFDQRMLRQTASRHALRPPRTTWECAMLQYARYVGQWNAARGEYKWHRLPPAPGCEAHTAIGDCRATLAVLRRMAE